MIILETSRTLRYFLRELIINIYVCNSLLKGHGLAHVFENQHPDVSLYLIIFDWVIFEIISVLPSSCDVLQRGLHAHEVLALCSISVSGGGWHCTWRAPRNKVRDFPMFYIHRLSFKSDTPTSLWIWEHASFLEMGNMQSNRIKPLFN